MGTMAGVIACLITLRRRDTEGVALALQPQNGGQDRCDNDLIKPPPHPPPKNHPRGHGSVSVSAGKKLLQSQTTSLSLLVFFFFLWFSKSQSDGGVGCLVVALSAVILAPPEILPFLAGTQELTVLMLISDKIEKCKSRQKLQWHFYRSRCFNSALFLSSMQRESK